MRLACVLWQRASETRALPFQMQCDIERVLLDEAAIQKRLDEMAAQITADYSDRELTVLAVLTGSLMFMSDLLRRVPLRLKFDCLSVVSYHGNAQSSGQVIFKDVNLPDLTGRDVLVLDDILDTGHTLAAISEKLRTTQTAQRSRVCAVKQKEAARAEC